jgi:hypothetical protein
MQNYACPLRGARARGSPACYRRIAAAPFTPTRRNHYAEAQARARGGGAKVSSMTLLVRPHYARRARGVGRNGRFLTADSGLKNQLLQAFTGFKANYARRCAPKRERFAMCWRIYLRRYDKRVLGSRRRRIRCFSRASVQARALTRAEDWPRLNPLVEIPKPRQF